MVGLVFFTPFVVHKFYKPIAIGPSTMGKAGTVLVLFMLQSTLVTRFAMLLTCVSTLIILSFFIISAIFILYLHEYIFYITNLGITNLFYDLQYFLLLGTNGLSR